MEYIVIVMIIFSIINSVVKAKKKREQAEKRLQEQGRGRVSPGEGMSTWQNQTFAPRETRGYPAEASGGPRSAMGTPYTERETPLTATGGGSYSPRQTSQPSAYSGEEGASLEYAEASVLKPAASRLQAPVESRNQAPIGSNMQSRMGTQMQTQGRSNNAPRSFAPPVAHPFGLFGDLMSEIENTLNGEKKAAEAARSSVHDSEGASEWNHTMQAGSMKMPQGVKEGECDDIAHYHSRVEGGSMIPQSSIASMSSTMLDNATTITATGASSPILSSVARGSTQFSGSDIRRAVIWSEILKRPQFGLPPRMR